MENETNELQKENTESKTNVKDKAHSVNSKLLEGNENLKKSVKKAISNHAKRKERIKKHVKSQRNVSTQSVPPQS